MSARTALAEYAAARGRVERLPPQADEHKTHRRRALLDELAALESELRCYSEWRDRVVYSDG